MLEEMATFTPHDRRHAGDTTDEEGRFRHVLAEFLDAHGLPEPRGREVVALRFDAFDRAHLETVADVLRR